jgi:hypothetical protein
VGADEIWQRSPSAPGPTPIPRAAWPPRLRRGAHRHRAGARHGQGDLRGSPTDSERNRPLVCPTAPSQGDPRSRPSPRRTGGPRRFPRVRPTPSRASTLVYELVVAPHERAGYAAAEDQPGVGWPCRTQRRRLGGDPCVYGARTRRGANCRAQSPTRVGRVRRSRTACGRPAAATPGRGRGPRHRPPAPPRSQAACPDSRLGIRLRGSRARATLSLPAIHAKPRIAAEARLADQTVECPAIRQSRASRQLPGDRPVSESCLLKRGG